MLEDLGLSVSTLHHIKSRNSFPSGDSVAKIAIYLGVTVDRLLGMSSPEKDPMQAALEAYLAMPEEERKAFVQEMSPIDPGIVPQNDEHRADDDHVAESKFRMLHAKLDAVKNEAGDSISALSAKKDALIETVDALVPALEPNRSWISQFLDLPSRQQKLLVLEALAIMSS
jgi:transcriptional regulator with XRE-family HTH domain